MNELRILTKIKNNISQFTEAEKKVGLYILDHPDFIPTMTTRELAQQAEASEASVVRFCKSIGVGSFKMLKVVLAKENTVSEANINNFSLLQTNDTPSSLFHKVTYFNKSAIELTLNTLDQKDFELAVEKIKTAEKIALFGVGGSYPPAIDVQYKLMKLGFNAIASADFHYTVSLLSMMKESDVLFVISTSGKTKEVLELAAFAKDQKVTVIALTALKKSPLYKTADFKLCIPDVEEEHRVGSIASRMAQLNIIDALYLSLFHQIGRKILGPLNKSREQLTKKKKN
ncbi:MurR/RpiR family transcriptional regulator [Peribacillus cavernae]|uniref:MurR/RpiR family transcriptional regulator n=1 Tax=Peribacillus cavernae TaxID=1674310 RepID=A0A433HQ30_9BACI|nr:MurR/RpiR family transcriptional regulator [Peribacillus cavernae]MDQ0217094.1 DNA-binding MurR/RpiR family transcriptional regulator [Peribacillus cavernae]RUQ30429.1 MurR/RpiR family transcriptional regulator [Peribacillus cavernae]